LEAAKERSDQGPLRGCKGGIEVLFFSAFLKKISIPSPWPLHPLRPRSYRSSALCLTD